MEKNSPLIKLGQNIRDLRKKLGISQENLALLAEVDRSYMGGIERGERNITMLTLVKIATSLNSSVSELTNGIQND
jgi:transcriptional regulator with XRE-family HTH domain